MDEFEQLKAWLAAWHARRDARAFEAFCRQWLQPAVRKAARRVSLSEHHTEDLSQEVALFFLKSTGIALQATSVAYWRKQVIWKLKDLLRKEGKLSERSADLEEGALDPEAPVTEHPDAFEGRFLATLSKGPDRPERLRAAFAKLAPSRRVFLLVHYHRELRGFFVEAEFEAIEQRSGWERARIHAFMETDSGDDVNTQLPLLFTAAEIEADRARCLDTFRKGRKRAFDDLMKHLGEEAP